MESPIAKISRSVLLLLCLSSIIFLFSFLIHGTAAGTSGTTTTYYVAANGSDSNDGKSKTTPWVHAPGMAGCAATCATTIPHPGDQFIFRGGDAWHGGIAPISLHWGWTWSGADGNNIYIGVDKTWFSGTSWSRPILTGDNPISVSPVLSCAHTVGGGNNFVFLGSSVKFVTFDNFEFTGMCWADVPNNGTDTYLAKTCDQQGVPCNLIVSNNYFHGWTHTPFNCNNGAGPVCDGAVALLGDSHNNGGLGNQTFNNVFDGSDSDDRSMSFVIGDAYDFHNNILRHSSVGGIVDNCHTIHDNLFEFINNAIDGHGHSDVWYCVSEYPGSTVVYNNVFRNIGTRFNVPLSTCLWLDPNGTDYVFNNVFHDVLATGNYFNLGCASLCGTGAGETVNLYNNTIVQNFSGPIVRNQDSPATIWKLANNHWVTNNGSGISSVFVSTANVSETAGVYQTVNVANAQGYTSASDYRPTSATNSTIGTGTNLANQCSLAGAGLCSTTTLGVWESGNTAMFPFIGPTARPAAGAGPWNVGAFGLGPPPPAGLSTAVH